MSDHEYAPKGYRFASVSTPSAFREYLLPVDGAPLTVADWVRFRELQTLAEVHGTAISYNSYRVG